MGHLDLLIYLYSVVVGTMVERAGELLPALSFQQFAGAAGHPSGFSMDQPAHRSPDLPCFAVRQSAYFMRRTEYEGLLDSRNMIDYLLNVMLFSLIIE